MSISFFCLWTNKVHQACSSHTFAVGQHCLWSIFVKWDSLDHLFLAMIVCSQVNFNNVVTSFINTLLYWFTFTSLSCWYSGIKIKQCFINISNKLFYIPNSLFRGWAKFKHDDDFVIFLWILFLRSMLLIRHLCWLKKLRYWQLKDAAVQFVTSHLMKLHPLMS